MELGLSLGDVPSSEPIGFLQANDREFTAVKKRGLSFCMALGGGGVDSEVNRGMEKSQEFHGIDDEEEEDNGGGSDDNRGEASLRLSLLPLSAVSRQISLPWSSDNGSSENDSSGDKGGTPAVRGLRLHVGSLPAAVMAEEVSSANIAGSQFKMGFVSMYKNGGYGGSPAVACSNKRDFEAAAAAMEAERESCRGSDDEDDRIGLNTRKKLRLSKEQSAFLEESFKEHHTLNPKQKLALANHLKLRPRQVEVWFQNRRARTKLKQTEVDCEYLKRCCETLTEENRKLHKELQDLRALKTSNHLSVQIPATTLTMCPSCERVTTAPANGKTTTPKPVPFPLISPSPVRI